MLTLTVQSYLTWVGPALETFAELFLGARVQVPGFLASLMDSCSHTKFSPFIKILDGSHTIGKIGTLVGRKRTLEMNSGSNIGSITSWQVIFGNLNYSRISFLVDQMGITAFLRLK